MLEPFDPKPKTTPLKDLVGESFAHFTLEAIIAPGVTGMVFRARDTQADRPAAVKVLSTEFTGTAEQQERFVLAIKTMLPVRYENLVELYAAGKRGPYCWVEEVGCRGGIKRPVAALSLPLGTGRHTILENGENAGQDDLGEIAWQIKKKLNRILAVTLSPVGTRFDLVKKFGWRLVYERIHFL